VCGTPATKGRVERAVPGVRDDCFAGEVLTTLAEARTWGQHWCLNEYGLRRHSRTQRRPLEHFQAEEQRLLLPAPSTPYDIPLWSDPKVGQDQPAAVDKALYSIPHPYVGQRVTARADVQIVRFYARGLLIKTHPRKAPVASRSMRTTIRSSAASMRCAMSRRCGVRRRPPAR
jgi:hypothetical protein